jgi:hypothetical protein
MSHLVLGALLLSLFQVGPQAPSPASVAPGSGVAVLEVFEGGVLLLSAGADNEARKGDRFVVSRLEPKPRFVGEAEVTAVGSRYVLARMRKAARAETVKVGHLTSLADKSPAENRTNDGKVLRGGAVIDQRPPK